ncbi:unnamed protein product [Angiostrongylus costaricensis]|uniref:Thymosin beta n=1 Tax=Angiostrongylus costaricensis TaxID=334426 RepID=A0A0R3PT59_ANGCS|nr:unnamed protein product [Angiostrongylus costaricensis]
MSTTATLYTVWAAGFYCWRQPDHPSIKVASTTPLQTKGVIKKEEGENKDAKLKTKTKPKKSEEKPRDVEMQEAPEPKKPSEGFEKDSRLSAQKNMGEGDE